MARASALCGRSSLRLLVIARYTECISRLSRAAYSIDRDDLGANLAEIAYCMEELSDEIAKQEHGILILRRAGCLIGTVEALIERVKKAAVVH
ncbi:hypothetical protein DTW90_21735 [Neorhizobium sp. P12A]|nr:hypothetical protein DTW90_21735 [Neorhizobium sp. P12A]